MENKKSLSHLLFPNQYRRKIFALLWARPAQSIHLRELARLTQSSPGTLKKELDALTAVGLLHVQKVGNQTLFNVNIEHPIYPELSGLIQKTVGLSDVLVNALQGLSQRIDFAFVFGSAAKGTDVARSDVDLLVVGDVTFGELANAVFDAQNVLAREINPKILSGAEWHEKKSTGHAFVHDILSKPKIFILGSEHEL